MAQRVQEYASALDVDEKMQVVARDALRSAREELNADYRRYHDDYDMEPQFAGAEDAEMASRLRALEHCPPESLGRAYFDFYQRYGLTFPGEPGGGDVIFVAHDFSHVLSGYEPDGPGELALQAMLVSATDGDQHFSNFCASLSLHEAGLLESTVAITPKVGTLARPGSGRGARRRDSARRAVHRRLRGDGPSRARRRAARGRASRAVDSGPPRLTRQVDARSRYRSRSSRL